jgi:NNP family nitrate/nitrite transporter-like MFS transporter
MRRNSSAAGRPIGSVSYYAVTFGGCVGFCSLLLLLLHDLYQLDAVMAGGIAALCELFGSLIRPVGGYVADWQGGLRTLYYVLPVIVGSVVAVTSPSLPMAVAMMVVATGAMGFGNGVVFQLVAERFPKDIGLASGIVGAAGGFGGFLLPIVTGTMKGVTGSYKPGSLAIRRMWGLCLGNGDRRIADSGSLCGRTLFLIGFTI